MDANACKQERFSSRTIGVVFLVVSVILFVVGLVILPVIGFVFAVPLIIIGVVMLMAPESKACRVIRQGLRVG
jgi:predicted membrane protein